MRVYLRDGSAQIILRAATLIEVADPTVHFVHFLVVVVVVGCLTSQQHASVSQARICSDNCTCCHTEIEVADQTVRLAQSQYTDTGPTRRLAG